MIRTKNDSPVNEFMADSELKSLLKTNKNSGWMAVYDKYAAVMYGNIFNITKDKALAEKIFIVAFKRLREDQSEVLICCSIPLYLCTFGKKITMEYLNSET